MKWLSQEWLDEVRRRAETQPERPGASARMQYVLTGGPAGTVRYYWVVEDGRLRENRLGEVDDPDLTLMLSYDDARRIQSGEIDEQAAFMQGLIKVEGDMAKMMSLLPITSSPEYRALQEEIRAFTDY